MSAVIFEAAGQRWNAEDYARNGRFVADHGASLIEWLAPQAGEKILDLGCGDGALSLQLMALDARVTGVDASEELVAAARKRGVKADIGDGQSLAYSSEFDAVFSNAALHWMKRDPDAVIAGVVRALKPGGRFVAEMGGAGNVASIRGALHEALARRGLSGSAADPWYFPTAAEYRSRLEAGGLSVRRIESFARPTPLPGDVSGWLRTFAQAFLQVLPDAEREPALAEIKAELKPMLKAADLWIADYVRLRFIAVKADRR